MIERFPVGRRIAFDAAKGRLWVVCTHCRRWNLSPIEERFEAIEDCERLYRGTSVRVSTDNIGLARMKDGLELVRVGAPLRPEFAAWRYAGQFLGRRQRANVTAGATVLGAAGLSVAVGVAAAPLVAMPAISIVALPLVAMTMVGLPVLGKTIATEYLE